MTAEPAPDVTEGSLLGGRVRYRQWRSGYRTGIEPVLLAAAVPARAGERVVEAGTGAGAALLCLAARVPGVIGLGIERNPALAALARDNVAANGFDGLAIESVALEHWRSAAPFDHALANPPWHAAEGSRSAAALRDEAKAADAGLLERWVGVLARALRPGGTLSLILPAAQTSRAIGALRGAGCGGIALLPLWPRAGTEAKLVIVRGARHSREPDRLLPGLELHDGAGAFTAAADRILREGAALPL